MAKHSHAVTEKTEILNVTDIRRVILAAAKEIAGGEDVSLSLHDRAWFKDDRFPTPRPNSVYATLTYKDGDDRSCETVLSFGDVKGLVARANGVRASAMENLYESASRATERFSGFSVTTFSSETLPGLASPAHRVKNLWRLLTQKTMG